MLYRDELAEYDTAFSQAPEPGELPEGTYEAQIVRAEIVRGSKDPTQLWLVLGFDVPNIGTSELMLLLTTTDEKRLGFLKRTLRRLGYTGGLVDVPDFLTRLDGEWCQITVRQNGSYRNLYVDKRIDASSTAGLPDEVPF